jgi:S-adenosylmethionine:tRNA ribosyltransferase-isomerase
MMEDRKFTLADFRFDLPEELIAQHPAQKRDESRLFVLDRKDESFTHSSFSDIVSFLGKGDLLVFNNARVIPARIFFRRGSGARVECVLVRRISAMIWLCIANKMARLKEGERLYAENDSSVSIVLNKRDEDYFEIETSVEFDKDVLEKIGRIPLPPYIRRTPTEEDFERYQTVYASKGCAAAAPTAGLHFTKELLGTIAEKGVLSEYLTLDVSWGTFQPVRSESLSGHVMHTESFDLPEESADRINAAREEGRRVIAVGTTSLRVLESTFDGKKNIAGRGETDIFIYPPRKVLSINALITNFHTPESTLLMLVASFAGYDLIMKAYKEAVSRGYRFFSYGDSMFIK